MPDLYHFLMKFDCLPVNLNRIPVNGEVLFEGFDTGIEIAAGRETIVALEYAALSGQRRRFRSGWRRRRRRHRRHSASDELRQAGCLFNHVRSNASAPDMVFPSPAAQNTDIWRLYRNTRPAGSAKEVFVNDSLFFAGDDATGKHAVENVRIWMRMVNNEHLSGAQFAFRRSDVWMLGFKSENAERLFAVDDHTRLEVLGRSFLNWADWQGPVVLSRDSSVSAMFFMWHWDAGTETIWQHETNGIVTKVPATRFTKLDKVDGAAIAIISKGCAQ